MTEITKISSQPLRIETGPLQFGDDWPGIFIRGDNALYFAHVLRTIVKDMETSWNRTALEGLANTLQSCSVGDTGWPPFPVI